MSWWHSAHPRLLFLPTITQSAVGMCKAAMVLVIKRLAEASSSLHGSRDAPKRQMAHC